MNKPNLKFVEGREFVTLKQYKALDKWADYWADKMADENLELELKVEGNKRQLDFLQELIKLSGTRLLAALELLKK